MALHSNLYLHPTDKAAMKALKAIPGFSQFIKAYMSIWNERQFRIMNMSSNLRISDKQLKKYNDLLPPICKKLGIDVPDLFLKLDVVPNSYTYGDTKPFIVITSGLFETLPEELIPTVIAHECGHIACHHTMYRTMGQLILKGTATAPGLASLVTLPLQIAFAYWMRCSELSADRAAIICDAAPGKMIETCMRLAGYDKDIPDTADMEAFIGQAEDYRTMVDDSKWNKTLEFLIYNQMDHPLNAVRAYECREWGNSTQFAKIMQYMNSDGSDELYVKELPMPEGSKHYIGMNYQEVEEVLKAAGFRNISLQKTNEKGLMTKEGQVRSITVGEEDSFDQGDWYEENTEIKLLYYGAETAEESAIAHQGKIQIPDSSKKYQGRNVQEVETELRDAGFKEIILEAQDMKKSLFNKENSIIKISAGGQTQFEKGAWFEPATIIRISFCKIIAEQKY